MLAGLKQEWFDAEVPLLKSRLPCAVLARILREPCAKKTCIILAGFVLSHIEPQVVCLGSCAVWLELAPSLRQKQFPLRGTSAMQCFATHGAYE